MNKNSIQKTVFSTSKGHYEFIKLPMGLKNAPAESSRQMQSILRNLSFVEINLDEIIINSNNIEENILHIQQVFEIHKITT